MSKWKQRDGTMIDMKDMTTEHLENAIKMLERVAEEGRTIRYGGGSDIQDFYYDEEFLQGKAFLDTVPEYKKLKKELKTRKKGNELKRLRKMRDEVERIEVLAHANGDTYAYDLMRTILRAGEE